ncbi:MAG: ATP-binding protein [Pannonibacter sp.]
MSGVAELMSSRLNRWTGEFADPQREAAYGAATFRETRATARIGVVASTLASVSFLPLDLQLIAPPDLYLFIGIRLALLVICIGALGLLSHATSARGVLAATYAQQAVFYFLNAIIFDHPALTRHGGMLLPLMALALPVLLPGRLWQASLMSAYAALVSLLFWGVLRAVPESPADIGVILLVTGVGLCVGVAARAQLNRMRREEFLHIERERKTNLELLAAKDAAEAGARAKSDFLAVMSHEIRTPMNGILGMVRLILDEPIPASQRERLSVVLRSAEALRVTLDDVLDLSKLEQGAASYDRSPLELARVLDDVIDLMRPRALEKRLDISLEVSGDVPGHVLGDPARLRQILLNLVGNAVKFTETGSVRLRLGRSGGGIRFEVEDTGIGISDRELARLFQPFVQADPSIQRRFGGSGLGLVICKRLIEDMGGSIGVSSVSGQGSVFHFELPLEPVEPAKEVTIVASHGPRRSLSLLLVEDNEINQQVAAAILQRAGHRCVVADTGGQALERVQDETFDAVLMDLQMPEMDGFEATRRIRALGAKGRMPIIALTANAMPEDVARSRAAGMNGHLAKPIRPQELDEMLAVIARGERPADGGGANEVASAIVPEGADVLLAGPATNAVQQRLSRLGLRVFPMPDLVAAARLAASRPFPLVLLTQASDLAAARSLPGTGNASPVLGLWLEADGEAPGVLPGELVLRATASDDALRRRLFGMAVASQAESGIDSLFDDVKVKALQSLFLRNLIEQRHDLKRESLDLQHILQIAHRVKGSAANMGFADLADSAEAVLAAGEARRTGARDALVQALDETIGRLDAALGTGPLRDGARRAE